MRSDEIEGHEVTDPLVELGRALEIGEQESEAGDLQALVDVERAGPIDVAKGLVRQQAACRQERLASADQVVERISGNPDRRQDTLLGTVLHGEPQRSRLQLRGFCRHADFVEYQRGMLAIACRLALDIEK